MKENLMIDKVKRVKYQLGNKIDKENILQHQYPYRVLRQGRIMLILVMVAFIFSPFAPAVAAEEEPVAPSGWKFQVAPAGVSDTALQRQGGHLLCCGNAFHPNIKKRNCG